MANSNQKIEVPIRARLEKYCQDLKQAEQETRTATGRMEKAGKVGFGGSIRNAIREGFNDRQAMSFMRGQLGASMIEGGVRAGGIIAEGLAEAIHTADWKSATRAVEDGLKSMPGMVGAAAQLGFGVFRLGRETLSAIGGVDFFAEDANKLMRQIQRMRAQNETFALGTEDQKFDFQQNTLRGQLEAQIKSLNLNDPENVGALQNAMNGLLASNRRVFEEQRRRGVEAEKQAQAEREATKAADARAAIEKRRQMLARSMVGSLSYLHEGQARAIDMRAEVGRDWLARKHLHDAMLTTPPELAMRRARATGVLADMVASDTAEKAVQDSARSLKKIERTIEHLASLGSVGP